MYVFKFQNTTTLYPTHRKSPVHNCHILLSWHLPCSLLLKQLHGLQALLLPQGYPHIQQDERECLSPVKGGAQWHWYLDDITSVCEINGRHVANGDRKLPLATYFVLPGTILCDQLLLASQLGWAVHIHRLQHVSAEGSAASVTSVEHGSLNSECATMLCHPPKMLATEQRDSCG